MRFWGEATKGQTDVIPAEAHRMGHRHGGGPGLGWRMPPGIKLGSTFSQPQASLSSGVMLLFLRNVVVLQALGLVNVESGVQRESGQQNANMYE
jgi:hypothetical protein